MPQYTLELINTNQNLTSKAEEINLVIQEILSGGKNGSSFASVSNIILIPPITPTRIILDVVESDKSWHKSFGNKLANDHGMRVYCNPLNQEEMFIWK